LSLLGRISLPGGLEQYFPVMIKRSLLAKLIDIDQIFGPGRGLFIAYKIFLADKLEMHSLQINLDSA
jgi:hypothetical protein